MKKTLSILSLLLFSATIFAQTVPQGINYQAVARDATGNEITNQSLIVQLSILSGSATGTVSWQETHAVSTNDYGLFTAIIGQGTSTGSGSVATFDAVDWGATTHYLKVEIDDGGGTYIDMGTTTFMSVPYALQSGDDGDWSVSGNNIHNANSGNVGIGTSSPIAELHLNGGRFLFSLDDPSYHSYINLNNTNHSLRFQTSGSAFAS
ncbi:MAG: hypothetical protein MK207_14125, partial [Saprospiraceae bacterium]|nr:hypothetical protein [Saprospiraceae bacterium]